MPKASKASVTVTKLPEEFILPEVNQKSIDGLIKEELVDCNVILTLTDESEPSSSGFQLQPRETQGLTVKEIDNIFKNAESGEDISTDKSGSDFHLSDSSDGESDVGLGLEDPHPPKRTYILNDGVCSWTDATFVPIRYVFNDSESGIKFSLYSSKNELCFFKEMLSEDIVDAVVKETNRYASQCLQYTDILPLHGILRNWKETSVEEMYLFFAVTMLMARSKKLSLNEYWSRIWLLETPAFPALISRARYLAILHMLHFSDNNEQPECARLFKIRHVLDLFRNNFKTKFVPFENLRIDKSLSLFKDHVQYKQHLKTGLHQSRLKLFVLRDVRTRFVLDCVVYTGESLDFFPDEKLGISGSIAMMLLQPYLGKGHSVYLDNWYTSPILVNELHTNKTNSCGEVKKSRQWMPVLDVPKTLNKGECQSKCTENMMALRWQNKREMTMLTTMHTSVMKDGNRRSWHNEDQVQKPECVVDYISNMGSINTTHMTLSSMECVQKTVKWYKKLFFHLIDISLVNAHGLYQLHAKKKISLADFQLRVISQLVESTHTPREFRLGGKHIDDMPLRLIERHFPSTVPSTGKRSNPCRKCHVCSRTEMGARKRRESRYMCSECDVGLCVDPCFRIYHTVQKY